jgi:3,4-dihydroxy 2-butanone 4-phosphate synthase/GTP cyclohydrolase II
VTTGISAADRAVTVQAAVAPHAKAADLVQPGHIFPLMAQDGGVLTRRPHRSRLRSGTAGRLRAVRHRRDPQRRRHHGRRPDLEIFAEQHGIKLGTIADLIEYRNQHETTVEKVAECKLPTEFGEFDLVTFRDTIDNQVHFALKKGRFRPTSRPWCGSTCTTC